jgi:hypothetical protein
MRKKTRLRKVWVTMLTLSTVVFFLASYGEGDYQEEPIRDWEQDPPIAQRVTVQQLEKPLETGENMLVEITFEKGEINQKEFVMYPSEEFKVLLHDDGINGDVRAGDFIFSAYVQEDLESFAKRLDESEESLKAFENQLMVFDGREGTIVRRESALFDRESFSKFEKVELSKDLFRLPARTPKDFIEKLGGPPPPPPPPPPGPAPLILKQNSLLITSLNVVEDPARTFDPCNGTFGSGNPNGAWTFGTMMKGMAYQSFTGVSARTFVRYWLNHWMVNKTINFENVPNRSARMLSMIITPWINKARHTNLPAVTSANWQTLWDGIHQDSLLKYAPFKLTAIVNRIDLRGNMGYGGSSSNSGETRFIFSVLKNTSTANCKDSLGSGGLDGFNVILEYRNPHSTCSALKAYGQQWVNLSTLTLGSPTYNAALEAITHQVTDSNTKASRPNRNSIGQIRTNEIALSNSNDVIGNLAPAPAWQFREFHLQAANNLLEQVPLHNEPQSKYNRLASATVADMTILANWVNANATAIINGTPAGNVPLTTGGQPFQAGKVNYRSISSTNAPSFWDGAAAPGAGFIINDKARQKFSENTCGGCHSRETRTVFTHVNYVSKGTAMQYMNTLNFVFNSANGTHKTHISPFLTGLDVILAPGATPPFVGGDYMLGDDSVSVAEDATDGSFTGLFYVSDPAGRTYDGVTVRKVGFNDLQRRAQDLSNFVMSSCSPVISFNMAQVAFFQPLNMAH